MRRLYAGTHARTVVVRTLLPSSTTRHTSGDSDDINDVGDGVSDGYGVDARESVGDGDAVGGSAGVLGDDNSVAERSTWIAPLAGSIGHHTGWVRALAAVDKTAAEAAATEGGGDRWRFSAACNYVRVWDDREEQDHRDNLGTATGNRGGGASALTDVSSTKIFTGDILALAAGGWWTDAVYTNGSKEAVNEAGMKGVYEAGKEAVNEAGMEAVAVKAAGEEDAIDDSTGSSSSGERRYIRRLFCGVADGTIRGWSISDCGDNNTAVRDTATSIIDTAVSNMAVNNTAVSNTAVSNTAVSNTAVNNTAVSNTAVSNTAVSNTAVSNTAVSNTAVSNTAVNNTAVSNTAVSNTAVSNTAVSNTAVSNTAVSNTAVSNTAVSNTAVSNMAVSNTGVNISTTAVDGGSSRGKGGNHGTTSSVCAPTLHLLAAAPAHAGRVSAVLLCPPWLISGCHGGSLRCHDARDLSPAPHPTGQLAELQRSEQKGPVAGQPEPEQRSEQHGHPLDAAHMGKVQALPKP
jgi:hypothetical protein